MIDFESAPDGVSGPSDFPKRPLPVGGALASGELPPYLTGLNEKQKEAVLITEGPLIVLAGAGSGKTKMLTSRIAYLIETLRVPAYQILAVTFTNKAAGEMRERVERTLNLAAKQAGITGALLASPEIGTFHAICVRILRRELSKTPFTKPFVIYDDSDQLSLIKTVFNKIGLDDKAVSPKSIQAAINRLKCDAVEPHEIEPAPHDVFERHLKRAYEEYQKQLFANNALDFGEILTMVYRIFRDHEDTRRKYQHRFRYIHVDEYQDTNRAQYLLLSMLAGARSGGHQNICVVGDEDQSIYKWRGADIKNILDFETDYPGAQVVKLEQNYRSTKTIITAASEVIKNNKTRKDKTLWTENSEGTKIVRAQLPDERAEAELVVSEIKRLAEHESRAFGDFSIFYRTNAQSRQFEDVFRREKIPYQIVGGLRFYDRKEIKDILAYFKIVLNPSDSVNMKRVINVPARGIGKTTIEKIDSLYQNQDSGLLGDLSFWEIIQKAASDSSLTSNAVAKKLAGFVNLTRRLIEEQPKLLLSELYHLILDETGYVRELRAEGTEESMSRIENLEEFDTLLQEFEEDNFHGVLEAEKEAKKKELLPIFIEQSALVTEGDKLDTFSSNVKLMTLHSSKGLEFPVVFLVGMEEGLFPSIKPWEETPDEDIEEERRLCYVGMTRAREQLYMMNVVVRRYWGNVNFQDPSRFFAELPEDLIEFKDYSYGAGGTSRNAQSFGRARSGYGAGAGSGNDYGTDSGPSYTSNDDAPAPRAQATFGQIRLPQNDVIGEKIEHPEYGLGTIISNEGSGHDQKVMVEFKNRQQRKFLLRYVATFIAKR